MPDAQGEPAVQAAPTPSTPVPPGPAWFQRLSSVLFIVFCFELGLFLLVYPWTDAWTENSISLLAPDTVESVWRHVWNSSYIRGGISGMGLVNIWIAVSEVFRMFGNRRAAAGR
jgi:quinol-cytochrome oxidoreductase complex cytochrome b subunit